MDIIHLGFTIGLLKFTFLITIMGFSQNFLVYIHMYIKIIKLMFALYVPVGRNISENSSAFIWANFDEYINVDILVNELTEGILVHNKITQQSTLLLII